MSSLQCVLFFVLTMCVYVHVTTFYICYLPTDPSWCAMGGCNKFQVGLTFPCVSGFSLPVSLLSTLFQIISFPESMFACSRIRFHFRYLSTANITTVDITIRYVTCGKPCRLGWIGLRRHFLKHTALRCTLLCLQKYLPHLPNYTPQTRLPVTLLSCFVPRSSLLE